MTTPTPQPSPYTPWAFRREDESDDRRFYDSPRLVVHVDEAAVKAITAYYSEALPGDGRIILDLMSSWRSHLPEGAAYKKVVGLGMNAVELAENPQLDERVVHDVNADPTLPFADETFDAAVVTVSVQYLTKPLEVFREVNRVLKPGANFHVVFSNRCFPTKAVAIWQRLGDEGHAELVASYFHHSGGWEVAEALDIGSRLGQSSDPVYVVRGRRT
ncbi:MAG: methyltransferase domain-containing protein [Dehalococcoidia bacterium]|nr:methyltransferase domain-containing protein [Dehalococcoidia bacterium]